VIVTFRLFFHMGSVECVTFQVPESQSREGGSAAVFLFDEDSFGARSTMGARLLGAASAMRAAKDDYEREKEERGKGPQ
jgi:hypothetical protein